MKNGGHVRRNEVGGRLAVEDDVSVANEPVDARIACVVGEEADGVGSVVDVVASGPVESAEDRQRRLVEEARRELEMEEGEDW